MPNIRSQTIVILFGTMLGTCVGACSSGTTVVRGSQASGLDQEAFGTGLDKHDLQTLLHENMKAFDKSAVLRRWRSENRPTVAVLPLRNDTSEHIDGPLEALIGDIETLLVEKGEVRVVNYERQSQLVDEVRFQHSGGFDKANIAQYGRQLGVRYFVSGKVFSNDERFGGERRVQYYLYLQIVEAETGEIVFQRKSQITKAIVRN